MSKIPFSSTFSQDPAGRIRDLFPKLFSVESVRPAGARTKNLVQTTARGFHSVCDKIRTRDLLVRSQTLYPAELHIHLTRHFITTFATEISLTKCLTYVKSFFKYIYFCKMLPLFCCRPDSKLAGRQQNASIKIAGRIDHPITT
jgi:hypothetical protein